MTVRSGRVEEQHAGQRLPIGTASPGAARRFTGSTLSTWGLDAHGDVAELLVSELVTNAINHGRTTCLLELTATPTVLRAAVADDGEGAPGCAMPGPRTRAGGAGHRGRARLAVGRRAHVVGQGRLVRDQPRCRAECSVTVPAGRGDRPGVDIVDQLVEDGDERVVVRVGGEVDTATGEALQRELLAIVRVRPRHLGLDLSAVDFLDSSGLRALLVVQQAVVSRGRQVRVVGSTPMIDRLLEITGLEALFPHDAVVSGVGRQPDG